MKQIQSPTTISSRSEFFHVVSGGPVFRLAEARGLLDPGAKAQPLCEFYAARLKTINAHRAQISREFSLLNLPAQRRNLNA